MRTLELIVCVGLALAGLSACETTKPHVDDGLAWTQVPVPPPTDGAIYQSGREVVLAENPIAHHVGDIVTIVLSEQTAAQKSATTTTSKATNIAMPGMTIIGKPVTINGNPITENSVNNQTKFDGEGASAQSNSLSGFLTVTVTKVLPNGYLYVVGEKQIGLNQGKEYVRLSGVIRVIDLAADDSIPSYRVANAHIAYSGKGAIADVNTQSWMSRFFNSPWVPF